MKPFFAALILWAVFSTVGESAFAETVVDSSRKGYLLFIPDSAAAPRPIVVCLPGHGVGARADLENWKSQARRYGFLLADVNFDYDRISSGADVEDCRAAITSIVRASKKYGADTARVYLGGSSAGGVLAMALSLKFPHDYRGVGVLGGGYLPEAWVSEADLKHARSQRYYLIRGETDTVISSGVHQETVRRLTQNGALISDVLYPGAGHSLPPVAYEEVGGWFRKLDDALPVQKFRRSRQANFLINKLRRFRRILFQMDENGAYSLVMSRIRRALG